MISKRSDDYRYTVDLLGADITPLAAVEAIVGPRPVRVHNISQGGVALLFDDDADYPKGEILDISISIRGRAFPLQLEVKGCRGRRLSCAFVTPSPAFQASLQEFLQPKFLGDAIQWSKELSEKSGAIELVSGATRYDAYLGQNQTGFFVWTDGSRTLLKLVGLSRDLVFEWSREEGLKTGRLLSKSDENISWDTAHEQAVVHYFADILLAWFKSDEGSYLVDRITTGDKSGTYRFPTF